MEFRHLRYFVAVAEELSFTRAAERLHIAQPPLSMQIRALEEELGVTLFARTRRKVALTASGETFLVRARQLLADADQARDEVLGAARGELGRLRVAFTSSLPYSPVFSDVIRAYRDAYPGVDLQLQELFSDRQFEALREGRLDVGLVRIPASHAPKGIVLREIWRDPVIVVMPAAHPLAQGAGVHLHELRNAAFITFPADGGTGLPLLLAQLSRAAGFEPRVVQVAREATTQIALVAAGVGLALLPAQLENVRLAGVRYLPVRDAGASVPLSVAMPTGREVPVVDRFLALLETITRGYRSAPPGNR
ncbi:LysR family transcriptional regulator [Nitrogeniibacter mangrovi]|uniref:LysR family transcriptional regulator n=1 Tax=Nitrogeniibacter mangrovi TaxID=2016596 RepID=A0A6C1B3I5_9RHOO|nr:LysR substrate-binding domain-containing protein [Nitrogeniibacter mangrovi]QID18206.1 LysR family transcriptional regulator [Nitrogeniibacter mangrovi]